MLRDICTDVLLISATITMASLSVCAVKATLDYMRKKSYDYAVQEFEDQDNADEEKPPISVIPMNPIIPEPFPQPDPIRISPVIQAPPASSIPPLPPTESVFPAPGPTNPKLTDPAPDLILECGGCHSHIKSPPIHSKRNGSKTEFRYQCEHCRSVVLIKV